MSGDEIWFSIATGEPSASLVRQKRAVFYREVREVGKAITNKQFLLWCFVIGIGQKSSSFWPPFFLLNEVSVYNFFYITQDEDVHFIYKNGGNGQLP